MKQSKPRPRVVTKQVVVVRRSSRVANKSSLVYAEVIVDRVMMPRTEFSKDFCKKNLPKGDDVVTLRDEEGDEYSTIYIFQGRRD
ncbi:unnamed protein product [Linum tenue]|uniref:Uncharacterized protein n=1 Tax=Linum tenue TaxID=586396 RepID=A0AAV0P309_9ROSI|nr:unnamed protein product [Linum tenue]